MTTSLNYTGQGKVSHIDSLRP